MVWPVALYGCETWTLRVEDKRRISAFEMTTYRRMMRADKLPAFICQGYVDGERARGRPRRRWVDDVKEWTGMTMADCVRSARNREQWRRMTSSTLVSDPQQ